MERESVPVPVAPPAVRRYYRLRMKTMRELPFDVWERFLADGNAPALLVAIRSLPLREPLHDVAHPSFHRIRDVELDGQAYRVCRLVDVDDGEARLFVEPTDTPDFHRCGVPYWLRGPALVRWVREESVYPTDGKSIGSRTALTGRALIPAIVGAVLMYVEPWAIPIVIYGVVIQAIIVLIKLRYPVVVGVSSLVPFVNLIVLGMVAFRRSPVEEDLADLRERVSQLEEALRLGPTSPSRGETASP